MPPDPPGPSAHSTASGLFEGATTADAWNAVAEPQRRPILTLLRGGERPAGEVARALRMAQPQVSKHLRVLRQVGLVHARGEGRRRLYGLDARGLRPIHEWVGGFEQYWNESFARLDDYVRSGASGSSRRGPSPPAA